MCIKKRFTPGHFLRNGVLAHGSLGTKLQVPVVSPIFINVIYITVSRFLYAYTETHLENPVLTYI